MRDGDSLLLRRNELVIPYLLMLTLRRGFGNRLAVIERAAPTCANQVPGVVYRLFGRQRPGFCGLLDGQLGKRWRFNKLPTELSAGEKPAGCRPRSSPWYVRTCNIDVRPKPVLWRENRRSASFSPKHQTCNGVHTGVKQPAAPATNAPQPRPCYTTPRNKRGLAHAG